MTAPVEVEWLPAGWMLVTWPDGRREEQEADREQAHLFAFGHGLRVCHVGQGGTVCHRSMNDTHGIRSGSSALSIHTAHQPAAPNAQGR